jgi:hypothetical protein
MADARNHEIGDTRIPLNTEMVQGNRRGDVWWRKWERLKAGESNGKLPLRTCLEMQRARAIPVA